MARTALTVESIAAGGTVPTFTAANADGHKATWSKDLRLYVKQGAGARVVTIQTAQTVNGLAVADRPITVAQNTDLEVIPLGYPEYVQSDGMVYIDYDATTNTTVAVVKGPVL